MKTIVIYDSVYGNTKKIAEIIATTLKADLKSVNEFEPQKIKNYDQIIIGTPTHGGQPKKEVKEFISQLLPNWLEEKQVVLFDTRASKESLNFFLKIIVDLIGYASPKMEKVFEEKGANVTNLEFFYVKGKEGPIEIEELEKAKNWSFQLA